MGNWIRRQAVRAEVMKGDAGNSNAIAIGGVSLAAILAAIAKFRL
jgi:hypothetical protein